MISAPERQIFYQAMLSRDRRFDGCFFAAVTTTGVYCRPICPAPKPKIKNVRFYSTSAGAERDGFRPCKRCRPDAAPGTPIWSGASTTVSRALQLIHSGYLDEHSVQQLGALLGLSDRQLRRLFKSHLGASPHAVALTRRLDFARKLIDETQLSMTDIAFTSGFESIRRFNDAVKKRFGQSPTDLRETVKKTKTGNGNKNLMVLHLPFRPPLDWPALLSYLKARQIKGVEVIAGKRYCRSIVMREITKDGKITEQHGVFTVTMPDRASHLELTLQISGINNLMNIVHRVRRIFDLEADPLFIFNHLKKDPGLSPIISSFPGFRIPGGWDNFEIALRTIIGQQVSIPAANTITGRLVQRYGTPIHDSFIPGITHLFPGPETLANADLKGIGLPIKRAGTIRVLAAKIANKEIVLEGMVNTESVKAQLMKIPGIGQWTTEYIAMRALREPDAFPATDLALTRELKEMSQQAECLNREIKRPDIWRPWRAYAAVALWKNYSHKATQRNLHLK
ncbi:MAG: DNA-3-methyladenine glycosylase 2 family protein [Candidatus Aminicenantes bacterium]|jgi:AraC family transcriptional regulator of adaptative response / DNA-3-methyladenine glycosylase II